MCDNETVAIMALFMFLFSIFDPARLWWVLHKWMRLMVKLTEKDVKSAKLSKCLFQIAWYLLSGRMEMLIDFNRWNLFRAISFPSKRITIQNNSISVDETLQRCWHCWPCITSIISFLLQHNRTCLTFLLTVDCICCSVLLLRVTCTNKINW